MKRLELLKHCQHLVDDEQPQATKVERIGDYAAALPFLPTKPEKIPALRPYSTRGQAFAMFLLLNAKQTANECSAAPSQKVVEQGRVVY